MARSGLSSVVSLASLLPLALAACTDGSVVLAGGGSTFGDGGGAGGGAGQGGSGQGGIPGVSGLSVGDTCAASTECRTGLVCTSGKCDFGHTTAEGSPCIASNECTTGLQCAPGVDSKTMLPSGPAVCTTPLADAGPEGASCLGDTGCQAGLRCGIVGFGTECVPQGTADVGQACTLSADCYAGLLCAPGQPVGASVPDGGDAGPPTLGPSTCVPIPLGGVPFGVPVAPPLTCEKETAGTVTAYFEVPGAADSAPSGDFFRLPFPNDARITKGKIDLTGFPTPGSSLLGFDPVQIYLDAVTANESAWGASPAVLFRFSGRLDNASISFVAGQPSPVQFLDITDPKNPGNGGAGWGYHPEAGKYICQDWIGVTGGVLTPGHTYTVMLTNALRNKDGKPVVPAPEFTAMLAATAPQDKALANAYAVYKPLRDYLTAQSVLPDSLVNAAVFTVGQVRDPMDKLAAAALAAPAPVATKWVKCDGASVSPCPQADGTRACGSGTADYDEYHALVSLPIFQKGTAPYLAAGGDIDSSGPVRTEDVCMSITVPKKTMPAAGFALSVFAHGTGGSFRDHVRDEVAGALARATPPIAVIGYDQVQHGPRRGTSTASPNKLFFNFKNPAAARGNPMQGAADVISMGRFAASLLVPGTATGGAAIKSDPTAVVFFGHSQGSMHGSLGLPYTSAYSAAVLSGNGASLAHALLTKTQPQNIASAVPFVLGLDYDGNHKLMGGDLHPVLTVIQQWIDPADPLHFGQSIARTPNAGVTPKSVFQTYGLGDTYAPPITLQKYALSAQLELAAHDPSVTKPDDIGGLTEQATPFAGNVVIQSNPQTTPPTETTITLAVREYQNAAGKDGHFVVFDVPSANQDVVRFLSMAAAGKVPAVGK